MNNLREQELTLKTKFTVTSADADMFKRLKLSGLVNFLLQSAIYSAERLGFGLNFLNRENLFWVLSRMNLIIEKTMHWNDEVTIETWPKTVDGVLYIRDFFVWDKYSELVAKCSSAWLAIDIIRKKPKIIDGIISEKFHALSWKKSIEEFPAKLDYHQGEKASEINPTYTDTDLNKHITTTRYIDWLMDTFSLDFHENNYPKQLSINFLKETMINETLEIFRTENPDKSFHFNTFNKIKDTATLRAKICF